MPDVLPFPGHRAQAADKGRPRPALFRALGKNDPPERVTVGDREYERVVIFKHDSWAATALYQCGNRKIVCKFNRQSSLLGVPAAWLGRWLARREANFYRLLSDLPNVPRGCGPISAAGKTLPYAAGHDYVEGRPVRREDRLPPAFFEALSASLAVLHERGIAYMDLHKQENVILGYDGKGYFIDFQVSFGVSPRTWFAPARWLLRRFQASDRYHLEKHRMRHAGVSWANRKSALAEARPVWIRAHRLIAQPLRSLRRQLLVWLGIRRHEGRAHSEHFTEDGLRAMEAKRKAA